MDGMEDPGCGRKGLTCWTRRSSTPSRRIARSPRVAPSKSSARGLKKTKPAATNSSSPRKSPEVGLYDYRAHRLTSKTSGTKKSRLFVSADATVFSDFLLNNVGNQVMVLDAFRFASGDDSVAGSQVSEQDVKLFASK